MITLAALFATRVGAAELVEKEGRAVDVIKPNSEPAPAPLGIKLIQKDRLSTGESSRAVLRMRNAWNARVGEKTLVEITEAALRAVNPDTLDVVRGQVLHYSREGKSEFRTLTPAGTGIGKQTQLFVRVLPDGRTFMQVLEGEVEFANDHGTVVLFAGDAAEATPGNAPRKATSVVEVRALLQWALYYPAVLEPGELGLTADDQRALQESLRAYEQGDLPGALAVYPKEFIATSNGAKLYRAAVVLAAGRVEEARELIADVPARQVGRVALERMLGAVLQIEQPGPAGTGSASEALAESYYQQSRRELERARSAAVRATALAPRSGYAWTRLAELEFSHGRTRVAREALERGLQVAPRNAQAHALRGYLLSAENRIDAAREAFERALQLDGALGNAWLGLGLTKIKQGRRLEGRRDLQMAATVEPTRSFFYSYHGKALEADGESALARKDFELAKRLDPHDPTPGLYSALQLQNENRPGAAVRELQDSIRLNSNRGLYRSDFLLDQDRAVRSANLARIYHDNGLTDVAVREAARAVNHDYTNPSAHLFLADSFDALRDPQRIALRHETAWFNERLLANLLAPVGGGSLSQFVSQQEYSKLLDADGFSGAAMTEWRDDGGRDHRISLAATSGRWSAAGDFAYWSDDGTRPNQAIVRREAYWQLKYQPTADDVVYTMGKWEHTDEGDLRQNYANVPGNRAERVENQQEPGLLLLGWNRRWAPGVHTLVIGSRLALQQTQVAPGSTQRLLQRDPAALRQAGLPNVMAKSDGSLDHGARRCPPRL